MKQTMLMVKTLNHLGNKDNVFLEVIHGGHCEYVYKADGNGEGKFAKIILPFLDKIK